MIRRACTITSSSSTGSVCLCNGSRRQKRDDVSLEECRDFWDSLHSPQEAAAVDDVIDRARQRLNPPPQNVADQAVAFALMHHGEQESCIRWEETPSGMRSYYHVKYAESADGIEWERSGHVAFDFAAPDETNIGRPYIVREDGRWAYASGRQVTRDELP